MVVRKKIQTETFKDTNLYENWIHLERVKRQLENLGGLDKSSESYHVFNYIVAARA